MCFCIVADLRASMNLCDQHADKDENSEQPEECWPWMYHMYHADDDSSHDTACCELLAGQTVCDQSHDGGELTGMVFCEVAHGVHGINST